MDEASMREQTARYVAAVMRAHPELIPEPICEIDQYPKRLTLSKKKSLSQTVMAAATEICTKHSLPVSRILSGNTRGFASKVKQEVFWYCNQILGLGQTDIGRVFGNNHSNVRYGVRRHAERTGKRVL